MREEGAVVDELRVRDVLPVDEEAVRHERVPVVEVGELQSDAVAVLETCVEEQGGIELEVQQVTTQVLHVLFYYNVDSLSCGTKTIKCHNWMSLTETNQQSVFGKGFSFFL